MFCLLFSERKPRPVQPVKRAHGRASRTLGRTGRAAEGGVVAQPVDVEESRRQTIAAQLQDYAQSSWFANLGPHTAA